MKKSLIALAVLSTIAGSVAAQSSVTVYGRFDQGYSDVSQTTAAGVKTDALNTGMNGGIGGSRLGFRGTEDLGGGLKANFVYELNFDAGDGTMGAARLGFADIASPTAGTVRVGRQISPVKAVLDGFRPSGNNTNFAPGEFYGEAAAAGNMRGYLNADNRVANAITYITPTFSGFSANLQTSEVSQTTVAGETNTAAAAANVNLNQPAGQNNGFGMGANYNVGKLELAIAKFEITAKVAGAQDVTDEVMTFAAAYNFGVAKVFGLYSESERQAVGVKTFDADLKTVGVTAPFGNIALSAEYTQGGDKDIVGRANEAGNDVKGYKLRAMYNLSKRTGVYGQIGESKMKSNQINAVGNDKIEGYNIGLVHTF
jgi:predicted porin